MSYYQSLIVTLVTFKTVVVLVILLIRPYGLFGTRQIER